jgi:hopene-associated glycosyltransferase HpnB
MIISAIALGLTVLSLGIWIGLICFRGQFWRADQRLSSDLPDLEPWPSVCAVVPARNEADVLPVSLRSLLTQNYPGAFTVILVDDQSTDGTAKIAQSVAEELDKSSQLNILSTSPLPSGWTGKLWALEQGIQQAQTLTTLPDYLLLTDADIEHDVANLRNLVVKAQQENLNLVSLMVLLRCQSLWEHLLIPAFVFFFQKLYPFRWVNDSTNPTAAAAGGCILVRRKALIYAGGIQVVRQALIDDCALAHAIKSTGQPQSGVKSQIWLGLTSSTHSLRPYDSLATIWEMVARTAFSQLNYSPILLLGTLMAMTLIYLVPPVGAILGGLTGNWPVAIAGLLGWLLMAWAYLPTLRLYRCSPLWAFCLSAIAFLYTLMTLDSALRHWRGQGGAWKGRVYSVPKP